MSLICLCALVHASCVMGVKSVIIIYTVRGIRHPAGPTGVRTRDAVETRRPLRGPHGGPVPVEVQVHLQCRRDQTES